MDISGKVVIITGASEGIGRAAAKQFASAGATAVLVARSDDRLKALAEELRESGHEAFPIPCDMRDRDAVNRMVGQAFAKYGRIDILINNAGQAAAGTVAEVDPDDCRLIIELNVYGPMYAMQAAVPKMRLGGGGLIINVSSMVSKMRIPGLGAYAATKAALNMLSDTARVELAADRIRVITVYPRMTATDFGRHSLGSQRMRQHQRASAAPAMAIDTPEQVAEKILLAARKEPDEQFMDGEPSD
jgi:NAD(P)-dependent dehydrogenase (short-subunit alcohol dehydrogenase family)